MNIPNHLIDKIMKGNAVLFLGAGALIGAKFPKGQFPPLGNDLRDRIANQFLSGDFSKDSLAWVAELAITASSLFEVQDFVAAQFSDLQPATFHNLMPSFRWRGIATTNYDRLVEISYSNSDQSIQKLVPFLSNSDRIDQKMRDPTSLAFLKLHGCITKTHYENLPLILTIDQYNTYRSSRSRIFQMLEEWGSENSIIFIGYKFQDPNLRGILLELSNNIPSRPRYYLIRPNVPEVERNFWSSKNITVIDGIFEDFMIELDSGISKTMRPLLARLRTDHPINSKFIVNDKPSTGLLEFLENDFEYIHEDIPFTASDPFRFYSGFGLDWYPIVSNLDVRRSLTDKLLDDIILRPENDRPAENELYLIRAEAGAGKSILLKRLAWEASTKAGVLCLVHRQNATAWLDSIRELSQATGERLFFFIDDAADSLKLIKELMEFARSNKLRITIITAERINEWNLRCEDLEDYLSDHYRLRYLSHNEIEKLVKLLTEHKALGPNLTGRNFEEQVSEFEKRAGRQLLVALHEATQGRPFEEIILDEFNRIIPQEAQRLYLTICVLNRMNIPVRAGLISRVHNISFKEFEDRFFKPLEHVVHISQLPWRDFAYISRHPEIAQIVFENVLLDSTERFNEYTRIIDALNPVYSVDQDAIREMLKAKRVYDLFPKVEDAVAIFRAFNEKLGESPHYLQQRANYERIRPNGNLRLAQKLLEEAIHLEPSDSTIVHTLAEVLRSRAESSEKPLERMRFRNESRVLLSKIKPNSPSAKHAAVTQFKLVIDKIKDILAESSSSDRDIDETVRDAERILENAKQRYPNDKYILTMESEFAKLIEDDNRSFDALKRARNANPRDPFIISRLSALLVKKNEIETAKMILKEALDSNRGDKRLNFQYAELLRMENLSSSEEISYYYRRAFTKWDENYESQFWFARFAYEHKNLDEIRESKEVFKHLRFAPMSFDDRIRVRDAIGGLMKPIIFFGSITRVEASHGFVEVDGRGDWVFFHEKKMRADVWDSLKSGVRVKFSIGFNMGGPTALGVQLECAQN